MISSKRRKPDPDNLKASSNNNKLWLATDAPKDLHVTLMHYLGV